MQTTGQFFSFLKDAFPPLALLALLSAFFFALLGWILSIRAGFRSEKGGRLRPWLIFPLTNPFALLVLLAMRFKTGLPALLCYLLALLALPLGGQLAQWLENAKISQHEANLQNRGETLRLDSLKPSPVPDASNIWMHPFLKPLAIAGQSTAEGQTVRKEINETDGSSPYKTFSAPRRFDACIIPTLQMKIRLSPPRQPCRPFTRSLWTRSRSKTAPLPKQKFPLLGKKLPR